MKDMIYEGKSKIVYTGKNDDTYIICYKDIATAFNGEKRAEFSGKARLNAAISNLIYLHLAERGIDTHVVEVIDETSVLVKKADIIMVEVIVRNVAAGSFSKKYGIAEGFALKNTVVEFSLKSDELGDPTINESQIIALGLATEEELSEITRQALKINELLCSLFEKARIRLIDFKLEFGRHRGKIILCDEISPDSCRLWDMDTNKKLDKDRFRLELEGVLEAYEDVLRRLRHVR